MADNLESESGSPRIVIMPHGSYHVYGNVPLVHKTQVVSEYGEPLTWVKGKTYTPTIKEGKDYYSLCRCGKSRNKPFCDGVHKEIGFDGTETAETSTTAERRTIDASGTGLVVKRDDYLCMLSGFCGNRQANVESLISQTQSPRIRSEIIAMIERCPSSAYAYSMKPGEADIEPDLPVQIAVTTEITAYGPIEGPFWVTGYIPVERSDGKPIETLNRMTLCNCGESCKKPYCDGTHRTIQEDVLKKGTNPE